MPINLQVLERSYISFPYTILNHFFFSNYLNLKRNPLIFCTTLVETVSWGTTQMCLHHLGFFFTKKSVVDIRFNQAKKYNLPSS